tara:strand:+ start:338 stop:1159 length:822 start_codon:yes stop_codon:yes gene_type:complete
MSKVGVGIITCNRKDFYEKCLSTVKLAAGNGAVDEIVVINDGDVYEDNNKDGLEYVQHDVNVGVGISKNEAMKLLLEKGCEHIFIMEDDIFVMNDNVFSKYIKAAQESGVWHLMFGYHGPANKNPDTKLPVPRLVMKYDNGVSLAFNRHCVGAFCYYHKAVLNNVGLMDERYINAWEHVSHSLSIVEAGLLPGYWWWPDIANSWDYLGEQACSEEIEKGAIRKRPDWSDNIQMGVKVFKEKHNHLPVSVPDTTEDEIAKRLNTIKERYSRSEA